MDREQKRRIEYALHRQGPFLEQGAGKLSVFNYPKIIMKKALFEFDNHGYSDDPKYCEWCLGQTIQALIEDAQEETGAMLLACSLSWYTADRWDGRQLAVTLSGPISIIKEFNRKYFMVDMPEDYTISPHFEALKTTLDLVLGPYVSVTEWGFKAETADLPANWREELLEIVCKKGTTNQGLSALITKGRVYEFANLRFRSQAEVKIAQALDRAKVMYFANCTARVNRGGDRANREPDFLICQEGHWGILEVDGEPFHPPTRTVHDHERDRLFERHGVRFVQHYDSERCYLEADQVVADFLDLMNKNG